MTKTNFIDGITAVSADWLNRHFGNGGHVHDGLDEDGHAPKVDLEDHIEYGDWGALSVTVDTEALHEITHEPISPTGIAQFAVGRLATNTLRSRSGNTVFIEGDGGAAGTLSVNVAQAVRLQLNDLAQFTALALSGETYVILSDLGGSSNPMRLEVPGTIEAENLAVDTIITDFTAQNISAQSAIAENTAAYWGRVEGGVVVNGFPDPGLAAVVADTVSTVPGFTITFSGRVDTLLLQPIGGSLGTYPPSNPLIPHILDGGSGSTVWRVGFWDIVASAWVQPDFSFTAFRNIA